MGIDRTDLGNAKVLVELYGRDLRYFAGRKKWLVWDGRRWAVDAKATLMQHAASVTYALEQHAASLYEEARHSDDDDREKLQKDASKLHAWAKVSRSRERLTAMVELAGYERGVLVTVDQLDSHPWLLNVQNGTVDLQTGTLAPHDPSQLHTKIAACEWRGPDYSSELWESFLRDITGSDEELSAFLRRSFGYAAYGAWREKSFWFAYGRPDGGKSTLLNIVGGVLGEYHVSADASTWMLQRNGGGGNRDDLTRLLGARLVTTSEVQPGSRFDPALMKKISGGDSLVAAAKFENSIEWKPTFALWLAANDPPRIADDDEGMFRRLNCVPCDVPVPAEKQDKQLAEKLCSPEHAPAVLAWLVRGCQEWQRAGLGSCEAVRRASRNYHATMNALSDFAEECLVFGAEHHVAAGELDHIYLQWCKWRGVKVPLRAKAFGARMRDLGGVNDDTTRKKGKRSWSGVGLAPHVLREHPTWLWGYEE